MQINAAHPPFSGVAHPSSVQHFNGGSHTGPRQADFWEKLADLDYHEAKRRVVDELHQHLLPRVLEECENNVSLAAKRLGLPRTSLHRMLKNLEELA